MCTNWDNAFKKYLEQLRGYPIKKLKLYYYCFHIYGNKILRYWHIYLHNNFKTIAITVLEVFVFMNQWYQSKTYYRIYFAPDINKCNKLFAKGLMQNAKK